MRDDLTIVYYTNNREKPEFAAKIRQTLLETIDGLPLISVSQQPLDFGENICVGDVGSSSQNALRQIQIGAIAAKTKFIATAEADCLYPKDYFEFVPPELDRIYCARPMWCLMARKGFACVYSPKRMGCLAAAVMHRETAIAAFERELDLLGMWGDVDEREARLPIIFDFMRRGYFSVSTPVLTIKTENGIHKSVPGYHGKRRSIPHWGPADQFMKRMSL